MVEQPVTDFSYSMIQRLHQEARYGQAITLLTRRIAAQPQDRMARLLLLLANVSQFGTSPFEREIEDLRFITDLSSNERHIVRQIFLVCFHHAEQNGQTIQKIVYQRLIRRLMLVQPLDLSVSDARAIEQSDDTPINSAALDATRWSEAKAARAQAEPDPEPPRWVDRWDGYALIGAGVMLIILLLVFYVANGPKTPMAQNPARLLALVDSDVPVETGGMQNPPTVILAPTFTAEPARRLIAGQLGELNKAYARWSAGDPATSGTVSLKLRVDPSGKVTDVEEAVSRLSEHRFLGVVVDEARQWEIPLGGTKTAELSVPLEFVPAKVVPTRLTSESKSKEPMVERQNFQTAHTNYTLEEVEPSIQELPIIARNEFADKTHTRGRLEPATDTGIAALSKENSYSLSKAKAKQNLAAASTIPTRETETARTAALKHEPRFAAEAIEKVGLGTRVTVLDKERDWIKVKVETSGNVGYLRKEYLLAFNTLR